MEGTRLVPDLLGQFWPIFVKLEEEFFATTVESLFDENISYQFYISLYVQIFNLLFCFLFKLSVKYVYFLVFLKNLPRTLRYMRTQLPMVAI